MPRLQNLKTATSLKVGVFLSFFVAVVVSFVCLPVCVFFKLLYKKLKD